MRVERLKELILGIVQNGLRLEGLYELAEKMNAPPENLNLTTPLEDIDKQTRNAVLAWSRAKGCPVKDVPIIPALEALHKDLAAEVQRIAFKGKQEILVDTDQTSRDFLDKVIQRAIEKPETLADHLEADIYSQLPEMLKRVTRVRPLTIGKMIPERLARRYREAVRSYVSGNPIACCALCRAVLEVTLKEEWGRRFPGRLNTDSIRLAEMIDKWDGTQRLSEDLLALCRKIKDNGNNAVHGDALLKSNEALESLAATQQVLKNLFA